jgi:hypothetical protein
VPREMSPSGSEFLDRYSTANLQLEYLSFPAHISMLPITESGKGSRKIGRSWGPGTCLPTECVSF